MAKADIAGAALQTASNAVSSVVNNYFNKKAATTAYNRQKELINDERNYMSPASQMSRLKEAGLNPNLIYGQLGQAGSVPQAQMQNTSDMSPLDIASLKQANAQTKLAEAQASDLENQSKNRDAAQKLQEDIAAHEKELKDKADNRADQAHTDLLAMHSAQRQEIYSRIGLNYQQGRQISANINYLNAQTEGFKIKNSISQKELDHWQEVFNETMREIRAKIRNLNANSALVEWQNHVNHVIDGYLGSDAPKMYSTPLLIQRLQWRDLGVNLVRNQLQLDAESAFNFFRYSIGSEARSAAMRGGFKLNVTPTTFNINNDGTVDVQTPLFLYFNSLTSGGGLLSTFLRTGR